MKLGRRLADIQFTSRAQRSGMIFHELALVPSVYFIDDLAPIHASAVQNENGEVILIGGTGGVGKTSLELELCLNHAYRFVADDVCVVDANGHAWPNLAYPKIYAYNLEDNPPLRRKVFENRGSLDRLHWNLRRRLGPSHVRRRLSPRELFGAYSADGGPLHLCAVLVRETRRAIQVEEISPERVADMSVAVLSTEFFEFNNHLNWHAFNRIASGEAPRTTVEEVSQRWRMLLRGVFENVTCRLIRIPIGMDHGTFKSRLPALLK